MENIFTVAKVIAPIFTAIFLGVLARKRNMITPEEIRGLQQFVMKFGLPCVLFNSCLTADVGAESLGAMVLTIVCLLSSALWAFHARKTHFRYHNFPQLFCAQETGMLGIPLFMVLFGSAQAYRMGSLDLAQAVVAIPTIAILSANTDENPSVRQIVGKVFSSPFLIMSLLGLALNLTGISRWMDSVGFRDVITESTGFLAQPVSAMMLFSVGYNFSLDKGNRAVIFRISLIHFILFILFGLLMQLGLFLIPNVDPETRWAVLIYSTLPASYLAPNLGRSKEDFTVASGVCSVLTAVSMIVFCFIAAMTA